MEEQKKVMVAFKLVKVEDQKRYVASVMASLNKAYKNAHTRQARDSLQQKMDHYGSIYHSLEGVGETIKTIKKPSKIQQYVIRLIGAITRTKKSAQAAA